MQIFDTSVKKRDVQDVTFVDKYRLSKSISIPHSITNVGENKRIIKVNITKPTLFTHADRSDPYLLIPGDSLVYSISYFYENRDH